MSEVFDEKFAEQDQLGEAPEFPDELIEPLQEFVVVGHLTDNFDYAGQAFSIATMTIGEELDALRAAQKYDDLPLAAGRVYATAMVAGAIRSLNGQPLAVPISQKQDIAGIRFGKVLDWYWPTIEVVYRRYTALEAKQKEVLDNLRNTLESDSTQEPTDSLE
jgi:hypothetical protein